jgi:hypothetical protein
MPVIHFTDLSVSRLKESGTYYDDTTPAFGLRDGKKRKTRIVVRGRERFQTCCNRGRSHRRVCGGKATPSGSS